MTQMSRRSLFAATGAGAVAAATGAIATPAVAAGKQRVRIATYNIYVGSDPAKVRRQLNRLARDYNCDVLLLQECSTKSLRRIFGEGHPGWGVFQAPGGGDRANSAVLWRKSIDRDVLNRGVKFDAADDSPAGQSFHGRYTAFVQLQLSNGARMRFESTHFAPARFRGISHGTMRRQHATNIVQRAKNLQDRGIGTIFGGDYNFSGDLFNMKSRGNLRMRKEGIDGFYISGRRLDIVQHKRIGDIKSDHHNPRLLVVDIPS